MMCCKPLNCHKYHALIGMLLVQMEIPEPSRETTEDEKQASLSCSYSPDNRLRRSRSSASSTLGSRDRTRNLALRFFRWKVYWAFLKDHAPSGAPALALYLSPAPWRLIGTWLGAPNSRAAGPWFLQPYTRPCRGPHRSLTVVPPYGQRRYYGEATARFRRSYGSMGGRKDASPGWATL
jgi:hypothetical protein